jgi:hypothetical protein
MTAAVEQMTHRGRRKVRPGGYVAGTSDYVMVGSGAAGSVLSARLTEEPATTVCVLECGPRDRHPFIHVPAGFVRMLCNRECTWRFKTEPSAGTAGQERTLGGSSSINGMVYNRGPRGDVDNWARRRIVAGVMSMSCRISSVPSGALALAITGSTAAPVNYRSLTSIGSIRCARRS